MSARDRMTERTIHQLRRISPTCRVTSTAMKDTLLSRETGTMRKQRIRMIPIITLGNTERLSGFTEKGRTSQTEGVKELEKKSEIRQGFAGEISDIPG